MSKRPEIDLKGLLKYLALIGFILFAIFSRPILTIVTGSSTPLAVVEGYSMFPLLREGDLVFAYRPPPNDIHVGDIIIYKSLTGQLIIHRVIKVAVYNGEYYYVTKGDNNIGPDLSQFRGPGISYDRVEGKIVTLNGYVFKIPYLGYLSIWYHKR